MQALDGILRHRLLFLTGDFITRVSSRNENSGKLVDWPETGDSADNNKGHIDLSEQDRLKAK